MPSPLSEPLFDRLRRTYPPDRAYTRDDWNEEAMPGPVRHFLTHLLRHQSRREARRLRRARTDWVDYDHPEMEAAVRTFFEAAEAHAQVPAEEWEATLQQAVTRTAEHLVRPVPVLVDFVFEDGDEALPLDRIRWRMRFFEPYGYLRDAVRAYAEKQEVDALAPDPFESVLRRVDRHIPADFGADRWLREMDPLFSTARAALGRERLPVALVQTVFEEKRQSEVAQRLAAYAQEGHEEIGPTVLHRLLAEGRPQGASAADETQADGRAAPETAPAEAPNADGPTPLWKQFQQGHSGPSGNGPASNGGEQPLWAQFRHGRSTRRSRVEGVDGPETGTAKEHEGRGASDEPTRRSPDDDLTRLERAVLGTERPSHRRVYIEELFEGSAEAYREVLQRLRAADSWGEASQIIARDVFREHSVNIYSDAAVHFTNAVEARFRASS